MLSDVPTHDQLIKLGGGRLPRVVMNSDELERLVSDCNDPVTLLARLRAAGIASMLVDESDKVPEMEMHLISGEKLVAIIKSVR